jgi:hypothetical protein
LGTPVPIKEREMAATWSSEVKPSKMTPEEIAARYGPPKPRKEDNPFHVRVLLAVKVSDSAEEAADLLNITVGQLNVYLGRNNIHPRWTKKKEEPEKEAEAVEALQEAAGKSRIEILREKLTKERYLAAKAEKKSDRVILKKLGMIAPSWLTALTSLKKEWGVDGLSVRKPEITMDAYQEEKRAAEAVGAFLKDLGKWLKCPAEVKRPPDEIANVEAYEAVSSFLMRVFPPRPPEEPEEINWATPFKNVNGEAYIRVYDKGVTINSFALAQMEGIRYVKVGAVRGKVVIMPTEKHDPERFTIGRSTSGRQACSAKIGGGALTLFLAKNGIKQGKYPLVKSDKGYWEASCGQAD